MVDVDLTGLIQLPHFRFPEHHLVAEWLNGTEYGEKFFLVLVESEHRREGFNSVKRITTPALEPVEGAEKFLMCLRADGQNAELSEAYTQKILDFHSR